ncbi:hypothetical protein PVK06_002074 [Gossypium arboreum]|uniref:Uncharacterized protein n=1 Tax=Gossypium arboreum TaxID=29729 RepID=A0ABR0R3R8_GOSAR|nr:hypothetical protein PVK06_002074 [Gossypium arboreum]
MCLIHPIVKGKKIDFGTIIHQEIVDCIARKTGILVFPSLVMLLCQQKGIVPRDGEEVLENKGQINEASIGRMTHGKDMAILKEAETKGTVVEKEVVAIEEEAIAKKEEVVEDEK